MINLVDKDPINKVMLNLFNSVNEIKLRFDLMRNYVSKSLIKKLIGG